MSGLLSIAVTLFFGLDIHMTIRDVLENIPPGSPLGSILGLVITLGAISYYYVQRLDAEAGEIDTGSPSGFSSDAGPPGRDDD